MDESLYEFNGECPVRRFIPRKPHPNGLLVYGMASYVHAGADQLPVVLDLEPYALDNQVTPQEAMMRLARRLRTRKPHLQPHLVVDAAFGSFDRLRELREVGTSPVSVLSHSHAVGLSATMSMAATVTPWLWDLLDWNCGVDEGRLALLPDNIVVSSFKVMSETGTFHQIKTISSGCSVDGEELVEEESVVRVSARRRTPDDQLEYETYFADGHTEWLLAGQFIDADGTVNDAWLAFSERNDLEEAFASFTLLQLKVPRPPSPLLLPSLQEMSAAQGWKSTGDKPRLLKRVVKRLLAASAGPDALKSRVESSVGRATSTEGPSAHLRRFYTNNFGVLDRFDRLWYEMRFVIRPRDWESHFAWSLLHAAVINARAAWCVAHEERVPIKTFLHDLVASFAADPANM